MDDGNNDELEPDVVWLGDMSAQLEPDQEGLRPGQGWSTLLTPGPLAIFGFALTVLAWFSTGWADAVTYVAEANDDADTSTRLRDQFLPEAVLAVGLGALALAASAASVRARNGAKDAPGWSVALGRAGVLLGSLSLLLRAGVLVALFLA